MVSEISFLRTKHLSLSFRGYAHPNSPVLTKFEKSSSLWGRHTTLLASISNEHWYQLYFLKLTDGEEERELFPHF